MKNLSQIAFCPVCIKPHDNGTTESMKRLQRCKRGGHEQKNAAQQQGLDCQCPENCHSLYFA